MAHCPPFSLIRLEGRSGSKGPLTWGCCHGWAYRKSGKEGVVRPICVLGAPLWLEEGWQPREPGVRAATGPWNGGGCALGSCSCSRESQIQVATQLSPTEHLQLAQSPPQLKAATKGRAPLEWAGVHSCCCSVRGWGWG